MNPTAPQQLSTHPAVMFRATFGMQQKVSHGSFLLASQREVLPRAELCASSSKGRSGPNTGTSLQDLWACVRGCGIY